MSPADSLAVVGFQRAMLGWHEYYLLAGTAAVTLMGLLFVSLSIHIERVAHESGRHLEAMAREAFTSFLIVLFVSLMMLTPAVSRRPLSVSLISLGLFRGLQALSRFRATLVRGVRDTRFPPRTMILRFLFPLFGSVLMIWAGTLLGRQSVEDGLALLMMSCVFLLADAARSSYELLVRTARDRLGEVKRG